MDPMWMFKFIFGWTCKLYIFYKNSILCAAVVLYEEFKCEFVCPEAQT